MTRDILGSPYNISPPVTFAIAEGNNRVNKGALQSWREVNRVLIVRTTHFIQSWIFVLKRARDSPVQARLLIRYFLYARDVAKSLRW